MTCTTNGKLRILAIHGYRQSDEIFKSKIGSLRKAFKRELEFTFAKAPHQIVVSSPDLDESSTNNANETDCEGLGWWFNTEDRTFKAVEPSNIAVGFNDSLEHIEKCFKESGPFDGLLGFSQGAAFVSILCQLKQQNLNPVIDFHFAVLISGFKSLCLPHAKFYKEIIKLPTLHVYGSTDKIIPTKMAKELSDLYENKKVVVHEGGHFVPGKRNIYDEFFKDMYNRKFCEV